MTAPKPITLDVIDAEEYSGPDPQPFAVVGGILADLIARVEELEATVGEGGGEG